MNGDHFIRRLMTKMKFLKNMFKKKKKYKLILTEDDLFYTLVPAVYMWLEDLKREEKEHEYFGKDKKHIEKTIKNCVEVIVKIKKAQGI